MAKRATAKQPSPEHWFAKFPKGLFCQKNMTAEERSVLIGVQSFAWEPNDQCFAVAEKIGQRVNMGRSATYRALNSAVAKGFLVKEARRGHPKQPAYRIPLEWWTQDPTLSERRSKKADNSVPPTGQVPSHQRDSSVPLVGLEGDGLERDDCEGDAASYLTLSIEGAADESQGQSIQEHKGKNTNPKTTPPRSARPPRTDDSDATPDVVKMLDALGHPPQTPKGRQVLVEKVARCLADYFLDDHSFKRYCKVLWPFVRGEYPVSIIKRAFTETAQSIADERVYSSIPAFFFGCLENYTKDEGLLEETEHSRPVERSQDLQEL